MLTFIAFNITLIVVTMVFLLSAKPRKNKMKMAVLEADSGEELKVKYTELMQDVTELPIESITIIKDNPKCARLIECIVVYK